MGEWRKEISSIFEAPGFVFRLDFGHCYIFTLLMILGIDKIFIFSSYPVMFIWETCNQNFEIFLISSTKPTNTRKVGSSNASFGWSMPFALYLSSMLA